MRILNWNIEWMNNWFVGGNAVAFRDQHESTGITDVADLCRRVAGVINDIDPDVVTVQEGPSDIREMLLFTDQYLVDNAGQPLYEVFGGIDGRSQKIYILVKRDGELKDPVVPEDEATAQLDEPWEADINGDLIIAGYEFTRLPVVVEGTIADDGSRVRIISVHTKSKYVHRGQSLWNNPDTRQQFVVAAMENRRRISSEAMRVRRYLDALLKVDQDAQIIVTGDFNDGPGIDYFEKRYLTHNVTDIMLGSSFRPDLLFKHTFLTAVPSERRYTAIFDDFVDDIDNRKLVLDHIVVSPSLAMRTEGNIAHDQYDAAIDNNATGRQKYPSDHRPVYADVSLGRRGRGSR